MELPLLLSDNMLRDYVSQFAPPPIRFGRRFMLTASTMLASRRRPNVLLDG